jgi:hypothetical protein
MRYRRMIQKSKSYIFQFQLCSFITLNQYIMISYTSYVGLLFIYYVLNWRQEQATSSCPKCST